METGAKPVESIRVMRIHVFSYGRKTLNCNCDSQLCIPLLALRATDSEVPSNFISKADVKVGLSNVIRY